MAATRFAIASDGARIAYEESGSGEGLLLHSGGNYDRRTWSGIREDFAAEYRVIVFDQRGTGASDKTVDLAYDPSTTAGDVIAILDHCGIARAHIGGLSHGGRVAMQVAVEHPSRVVSLTLVSTSPGGPRDVRPDPSASERSLLSKMYSQEWLDAHPGQLEEQQEVYATSSAEVRAKRAAQAHDLWDALSTIAAPTLVLHGTEDEVCAPENAHLIAKRIPDARLVMIPGGRHGMHREFRGEVADAVLAFLRAHPITRAAASLGSPHTAGPVGPPSRDQPTS